MRLFDGVASLPQRRVWRRVAEAVACAPTLPAGPAFSVGDSLTYRRGDGRTVGTEDLVGRRRYRLVVAALGDDITVEVAAKATLTPTSGYSDLTDREHFEGAGDLVRVPPGAVLVVDLDEAARVLPSTAGDAVVLHVTVEGGAP